MTGHVFLNALVVFGLLHYFSNVSAFNGRCPAGWTVYEHSCYKLYKTPKRSFPDAQSKCEDAHGALTSISSAKENDFLHGIAGSSPFWIGLNDIREEGVFQWTDGTQFRYSLDNNTNQNHEDSAGSGVSPSPEPSTSPKYVYNHDAELDFSMWHNEEPNNAGRRNENCVQVRFFGGSWNDLKCASRVMFMCETEANEEGTLAETTIKCPHSFEAVFELGASKTVTWSEPAYLANSLASHIERSHSPGAEFRNGLTWVNYTFSDPYNNTATCNFSITVLEVDTTPPTIMLCPPDVTVTKITNVPITVTWEQPVATDVSEIVTLLSQSHVPGDEVELGLNNVAYKFSDDSGNEAFCFFNIYVFDVNNPLESPSDDNSSGLFIGLYIILTFIGVALALVLLILFRKKGDSGGGKLSYARMNGDAEVDIGI